MKKSTAFILWLVGFLMGAVVGVLAAMKIMLEEDDDYDFDEIDEDFEDYDAIEEEKEEAIGEAAPVSF